MSATQINEEVQAMQEHLMEYISQVTKGTSYVEKKGRYFKVTVSEGADEQIVYIETHNNAAYGIRQYRVLKGMEYRIWGKNVCYTGTNPIALFTQGADEGMQNAGAVIVNYEQELDENDKRILQDYDEMFIPETDGYISVATYSTFKSLRVDLVYGKPLKIQVFGDSMSDNKYATTWLDCLPDEMKGFDLNLKNSAIGGSSLTYVYPEEDQKDTENQEGTENQEDTENQEGTEDQEGIESQEVTENQEDAEEEKPGVAYLITDAEGSVLEEDNDLVIVFAGCNDWAGEIKSVGHMGDDSTDTIYGAVEKIIQKVCGGTDTKLMFLTPMQRNNDDDKVRPVDGQGNMLNKRGEKGCFPLVSVVDAIKEVCAKHAVPCVDMYREGCFNLHNIDQMTYDGLHASETGAKLLAKLIAARIKMLL